LRIPARPVRAGCPEQSAPPTSRENIVNKSQLIDAVAAKSGLTKAAVTAMVNATTEVVQEAVAAGDTVQITGFGSFERRFREGGERRNPRGGTVLVESKHVPAFRAGEGFRKTVAAA
jgi:DNA-binding protein HU-beta